MTGKMNAAEHIKAKIFFGFLVGRPFEIIGWCVLYLSLSLSFSMIWDIEVALLTPRFAWLVG